jgi:hypothetical protein
MQSISSGMGNGTIKSVDLSDVMEEEWADFLTIDLKLKTSPVFTASL